MGGHSASSPRYQAPSTSVVGNISIRASSETSLASAGMPIMPFPPLSTSVILHRGGRDEGGEIARGSQQCCMFFVAFYETVHRRYRHSRREGGQTTREGNEKKLTPRTISLWRYRPENNLDRRTRPPAPRRRRPVGNWPGWRLRPKLRSSSRPLVGPVRPPSFPLRRLHFSV